MNRRELAGYTPIIRPVLTKAQIKAYELNEQYELIGYGEEGDSEPDALLRCRGGTIFNTSEEAWDAIEKTKKICKGDHWLNDFEFGVMPLYKSVK